MTQHQVDSIATELFFDMSYSTTTESYEAFASILKAFLHFAKVSGWDHR